MAPLAQYLTLALYSVTSLASPLERRAEIDHDTVVGFPETVPSGTLGSLYLKYKPFLKVENGCVPFPAVDASGNTGAGLNPSGAPSAGCSSSTGQVYARGGTYNGRFAIMYAWYMPKDSPSTGLGHRHDWESAVVWLSAQSTTASIVGGAASAHGEFDTTTTPNLSDNSLLIKYYSIWPLDHQMGFTSTRGGQQPLIAWESLPAAAKTALTNTDFGSANVPFKDSNFASNLEKAYPL